MKIKNLVDDNHEINFAYGWRGLFIIVSSYHPEEGGYGFHTYIGIGKPDNGYWQFGLRNYAY